MAHLPKQPITAHGIYITAGMPIRSLTHLKSPLDFRIVSALLSCQQLRISYGIIIIISALQYPIMPRQQRRAAPAPARSAPTRPTAAPARPAPSPQQQAPHSTAAHPQQHQQAPPPMQAPPQQSAGPGLFGQMASTAA